MAWSERVRAWRASGQTAPEFAQGRGFEASTLRYWASRLGRDGAAAAESPPRRVRLLRVTPAPSRAATEPVVVSVGAARIEVRAGFDRALLREVVDALGGTR
jgi:hypothetical protein